MKSKREPLSSLQESLDLEDEKEKRAAFRGLDTRLGALALPPHVFQSFSKQFSQRGGKTGSGKKNDMESHLLIRVPGERKTKFPLWSNYSLVFLMKPNQASFQYLADVSEA